MPPVSHGPSTWNVPVSRPLRCSRAFAAACNGRVSAGRTSSAMSVRRLRPLLISLPPVVLRMVLAFGLNIRLLLWLVRQSTGWTQAGGSLGVRSDTEGTRQVAAVRSARRLEARVDRPALDA